NQISNNTPTEFQNLAEAKPNYWNIQFRNLHQPYYKNTQFVVDTPQCIPPYAGRLEAEIYYNQPWLPNHNNWQLSKQHKALD
ncbi:hypothetical protein, partial [Escherichia coli]|uniref:hypothetical protein n=1 Tax=Escherichia coli TaxID=562 RepID=UPI003B7696E2